MRINDYRPTEILRHGAYLCLQVPETERGTAIDFDMTSLLQRFALKNEFDTQDGHPNEAIAFLRRVDGTAGVVSDEGLLNADAVVHVATPAATSLSQFCEQFASSLGTAIKLRILRGVLRPMSFTGNTMHNFAYAHQLQQQSGFAAPNAFLVPLNKTKEWWTKDWMERHTYFLPRYDEQGRMASEGHALAAAAGIPHMMRRTYKGETEPAPANAYDFLTYFECADKDIPVFHSVLASLRDVKKNPEWKFVREGPTWQGHRVATWRELFS